MSNLFGLDDSDGNEDWGQGHILCTFVHFVDLVKEYASQGNQEVNEKMKEEQTQVNPENQTEEIKSENISILLLIL